MRCGSHGYGGGLLGEKGWCGKLTWEGEQENRERMECGHGEDYSWDCCLLLSEIRNWKTESN